MLNGYTLEFTGVATRVDLVGSNNNLVDVFIPSGISMVPSNSAGLQIYTLGGGLADVNIVQVNGIDVDGAGTAGDPWGPV